MYRSNIEEQARLYAERHGFKIKRIPYSLQYPNGYVQVVTPSGISIKADDMTQALDKMVSYRKTTNLY